MKGVAVTLSLYVARQFTFAVIAMISALTGLVSLFDLIDLLRRAATRENVGFGLVLQIAVLHVPYDALEIMPFAVLLGGIVAFWRLTRSSELIVARAAGISAWQFLAAPLASAMTLGILCTAVISPLSSVMYGRAETLDRTWLRNDPGPLDTAGGQLWLRQLDRGVVADGVAILHARGVRLDHKSLEVSDLTVFRLDGSDRLLYRIESPHAVLEGDHWQIDRARTIAPDALPVAAGTIMLPTDLTVARVQESFASPDTLSVWTLPGFIRLLDRSGFSSIRHRLHFQSLLALPLLASTMSLVAAGFSMRPARRGGVAQMIGSGLVAGFALFTISNVAERFGESGALPTIMAAWAPTGAGLLLAIALLLHLEDG